MSESDDRTRATDEADEADEAVEDYSQSSQTSQDRGDAGGGFGGGAGSEEHHQPGGRGSGVGPGSSRPKDSYASSSPADMDLQAGASSGGATGQDRRGGFATDPAEAAGLLPAPDGSGSSRQKASASEESEESDGAARDGE